MEFLYQARKHGIVIRQPLEKHAQGSRYNALLVILPPRRAFIFR